MSSWVSNNPQKQDHTYLAHGCTKTLYPLETNCFTCSGDNGARRSHIPYSSRTMPSVLLPGYIFSLDEKRADRTILCCDLLANARLETPLRQRIIFLTDEPNKNRLPKYISLYFYPVRSTRYRTLNILVL
jgi:hypothetical protein